MEENNITVNKAVQTIKGAILRAQAQASQSSNAIQLSLYYGIGRYVSINLQQAHWGAKLPLLWFGQLYLLLYCFLPLYSVLILLQR